jgi:hypothetical protein
MTTALVLSNDIATSLTGGPGSPNDVHAANFVPALWSDEVVAVYKSNLVLANLIRKLNHRGKKGDTIHIPTPARGTAVNKVAQSVVTLQPFVDQSGVGGITITINKHKEYSRLIEDIVDVQALPSLRRFYTDDSGYAIAKRVDRDIFFQLGSGTAVAGPVGTFIEDPATGNVLASSTASLFVGDGQTVYNPAANAGAGNATDLTDLGIRRGILKLDQVDAPMAARYLVLPPVAKALLLGVARFTQQAFTGEAGPGNSIRNGLVGNVYAVEVYVSNNLPNIFSNSGAVGGSIAWMIQRDAAVLVEQMGIRTQQQYKQEFLADLFTADMIYGTGMLRSGSAVPFVTNNLLDA